MNIYPSFLGDFRKKGQHCLEICFDNEEIIYLAAFHDEQILAWLNYLILAKKYNEWLIKINEVLK